MEQFTVSSELTRVKWACYVVALAGTLITVFTAIMIIGILMRDSGKPQFIYELVIASCAVIYFSGVTLQAIRASRFARKEQELPQTLHYLSLCVIALFAPIGLLGAYLVWMLFQPVY
jgi:high-affinity Fe2+/Pb2+ permease